MCIFSCRQVRVFSYHKHNTLHLVGATELSFIYRYISMLCMMTYLYKKRGTEGTNARIIACSHFPQTLVPPGPYSYYSERRKRVTNPLPITKMPANTAKPPVTTYQNTSGEPVFGCRSRTASDDTSAAACCRSTCGVTAGSFEDIASFSAFHFDMKFRHSDCPS